MIFEVIVDISNSEVDRVFDYIGDESVNVGSRVSVPFGKRNIEGFVINKKEQSNVDETKLKKISKVLDDFVTINDEMLSLMRFMVSELHIRLIDALRLFLPSQMRGGRIESLKIKVAYINKDLPKEEMLSSLSKSAKNQKALIEFLAENEKGNFTQLSQKYGAASIRALEQKGFLTVKEEKQNRIPYKNLIGNKTELVHTQDQTNAIETILNSEKDTFLLFGVTGSGKTEIYMSVIDSILTKNQTAIMLVPEISLTPNMLKLFRTRYGEQVAILHSGLSAGERYDEWLRLKTGEAKIALGARSAVFAPLENVGVIIIDEEHDSSYQSESNPRYNTYDIATFRKNFNKAKLVLGSATPSVETFFKAQNNEIFLIQLKNRINNRPLPEVEIVDMAKELRGGNKSFLSQRLFDELKDTIKKGNQAILFLNRRGYSSFVMCAKCGYTAKCFDCDVSLSYHADENLLKCHYCGKRYRMFDLCPECKSPFIRKGKIGTERVVSELKSLFPDVGILRMDFDTTKNKEAHSKIIQEFAQKKAQILVGTQMVAKGHDFKDVTLVGILDADQSLHFEDYRAGERTFQLLTQVSGRSGRDKKQGKVVLQTYSPENYILRFAVNYDYLGFFKNEVELRRTTKFPPFSLICRVMVTAERDESALEALKGVYFGAEELRQRHPQEFIFLNKMHSPIKKIQGRVRYQVLMRLESTLLLPKIYDLAVKYTSAEALVYVEENPVNLS